jgi:hypothetical protein
MNSPDAEMGELREQRHNTILEYEESMWVWEEMKDTGELDSSDTDSEEKDELTSEDLLQALDKAPTAVSLKGFCEYRSRDRVEHRSDQLGRELLQGVPQAVTA